MSKSKLSRGPCNPIIATKSFSSPKKQLRRIFAIMERGSGNYDGGRISGNYDARVSAARQTLPKWPISPLLSSSADQRPSKVSSETRIIGFVSFQIILLLRMRMEFWRWSFGDLSFDQRVVSEFHSRLQIWESGQSSVPGFPRISPQNDRISPQICSGLPRRVFFEWKKLRRRWQRKTDGWSEFCDAVSRPRWEIPVVLAATAMHWHL